MVHGYLSTFMIRAIPKICSSVCRFILTRVSALPFDGQCSSFGPRGDAPRWNHRTIFDVEFDLAASERLEGMEVVDIKASSPLVTV